MQENYNITIQQPTPHNPQPTTRPQLHSAPHAHQRIPHHQQQQGQREEEHSKTNTAALASHSSAVHHVDRTMKAGNSVGRETTSKLPPTTPIPASPSQMTPLHQPAATAKSGKSRQHPGVLANGKGKKREGKFIRPKTTPTGMSLRQRSSILRPKAHEDQQSPLPPPTANPNKRKRNQKNRDRRNRCSNPAEELPDFLPTELSFNEEDTQQELSAIVVDALKSLDEDDEI